MQSVGAQSAFGPSSSADGVCGRLLKWPACKDESLVDTYLRS